MVNNLSFADESDWDAPYIVSSVEVIERYVFGKPYYELKYKLVNESDYHIGFGSYNLENVIKWKSQWFKIVDEHNTVETN